MGSQSTDHRKAQYSKVLSLSHLQRYHEEENGFLSQIVTGDETWGDHFEPESKLQSKKWKRATSPPPNKSKVVHTSSVNWFRLNVPYNNSGFKTIQSKKKKKKSQKRLQWAPEEGGGGGRVLFREESRFSSNRHLERK
ncbi:histone-lysine N-methyltransferase SETMAR [Trichonephila clavipes]|nr:histone-lysine N-methyltransferase SETMAR [Trichonephila clavipes]